MQRADANQEIIQHIQNGDVNEVNNYIKADPSRLNQPIDNDGNTLLQLAVMANKPAVVTDICKNRNIDYGVTNNAGQNALQVCNAQLEKYPADDADNREIRMQIVAMRKTINDSRPGAIVEMDGAERFRANNDMDKFAKAMTEAGDASVVKLMGDNLNSIKKSLEGGSMKEVASSMLLLQDMKSKHEDLLGQRQHAGMRKDFIKTESALQDAMLVAVKKFADEVRPLVAEEIKAATNQFKKDYGQALFYSAQSREELTKVTSEMGSHVKIAQDPQHSKSAPEIGSPAPQRNAETREAMTNYLKNFNAILNSEKSDNVKREQIAALRTQNQDLVKGDKAVESMTNGELRRLEQTQQRRGSLAPAKRIESASPSPGGTPNASPAIRRKEVKKDEPQQEAKNAPAGPSRRM